MATAVPPSAPEVGTRKHHLLNIALLNEELDEEIRYQAAATVVKCAHEYARRIFRQFESGAFSDAEINAVSDSDTQIYYYHHLVDADLLGTEPSKRDRIINAHLARPGTHPTEIAAVTDASAEYARRICCELDAGLIADSTIDDARDPDLQAEYAQALDTR